jgi:prepilin-type processing-associated H-X9-DG protein
VELLVVIGIIALLAGIALGVLSKVRKSAQQTQCLANLRQISSAIIHFSLDQGGKFPDPVERETSWEELISTKTDIRPVLGCPSDEEVFPTVGSSYDWRDTGNPATTLVNAAIASVQGDTVLAFEALPSWHVKEYINVAYVDGSVRTVSSRDALKNLAQSLRPPVPANKRKGSP